MGQQQLLLIVLGVIIVGIAIVVGITMFKSNAVSANRDQVINDLQNLGAKAQQYYMKPVSMAGGNKDFKGFALTALDTGNANGSYSATTTTPSGATVVWGNIGPLSTSSGTVYIVGSGNQTGNDAINYVKAYVKVTADSAGATVLN